jgi:hypothetical protein
MYDIGVFFPFWKFLGVLKRIKVYRFLQVKKQQNPTPKKDRMLHPKRSKQQHNQNQ